MPSRPSDSPPTETEAPRDSPTSILRPVKALKTPSRRLVLNSTEDPSELTSPTQKETEVVSEEAEVASEVAEAEEASAETEEAQEKVDSEKVASEKAASEEKAKEKEDSEEAVVAKEVASEEATEIRAKGFKKNDPYSLDKNGGEEYGPASSLSGSRVVTFGKFLR